jgi:hypothetical protein
MRKPLMILAILALAFGTASAGMQSPVSASDSTAEKAIQSISIVAPEKGYDHIGANYSVNSFRQGGEDIASATIIDGLPYSDFGTTAGHVDDYDEVCPYTGSTSPDVVYSYTPIASESLNMDLCESAFDTKLYVYDSAMTSIACNDDSCPGYMSELFDVPVTAGETYYIVVDGYSGDSGDYVLNVSAAAPCVVDPPVGAYVDEGETALIPDYVDVYNGGCNSDPAIWQTLALDTNGSATMYGVAGWYMAGANSTRDTDWYEVTAMDNEMTLTLTSEYASALYTIVPVDCAEVAVDQSLETVPCEAGSLTFVTNPGSTYWIFVAATTYEGPVNEYHYILDVATSHFEECVLDIPANPVMEGEGHLSPDYVDVINGGCNSAPPVYGQIPGDVNGEASLWGISGWYTNAGSDTRDTDWYEVIAGGTEITVTAESEQIFWVVAAMPPFDCDALTLGSDVTLEPCVEGTFTIPTVAGETYWIIALPTTYSGPVAEFRYILNVSGLEADFIPSDFADITVSDSFIDFGEVGVGMTGETFMTVGNIGLLQLDVTVSVIGDGFDFMPNGFNLPYMAEDDIAIYFNPTEAIDYNGVLTLSSNDPDDPVVEIPLTGYGAHSATIAVSPALLDVSVESGTTADYPLTISNSGLGELTYSIEIEGASARSTVQFGDNGNNDIIASGHVVPISSTPWTEQEMFVGNTTDIDATAVHGAASGLNAMNRGEQVFGDASNAYGPGGTRNRGNFFYCDTSTTLLEHRFYLNPTAAGDMQFLVYECPTDVGTYTLISNAVITGAGPGEGWYSSGDIAVPLTEGNFYILTTWWDADANYYNQQEIAPFPIDTEFGQLVTACGWAWGFSSENPAVNTVDVPIDPFDGSPVAYHQAVVTGSGTSWLSVNTASGTVASGGSEDVTVTFDTAGLCGSSYSANIIVSSNDLATPVVTVPATMTVTGNSPNLDVSDIYDFGEAYLYNTAEQTVIVSNSGCATLEIANIATTGDFSVSDTGALLESGESMELIVTFFPLTLGAHTGTMTFTSNDPDSPEMVFNLTGTAVEPPVIGTTPSSVDYSVSPGENGSTVLTVNNSGGSALDFTASAVFGRAGSVNYDYTPHEKGKPDMNVGGRGAGGPDMFGYSWMDSDEAGGPVYSWNDISATGVLAFSDGDDSSHGPFALGFDFEFYGQTFNSVLLCSNGFISFTDSAAPYSNGMIPDPSSPMNMIAPFWDDLNPADGGDCYYMQDGNDFIIQYEAFVPYGGAGGPYTFEVILSADGSIKYQYKTMSDPLDGATIGIQNGDGTDGLLIAYNAPYIHDSMAIWIGTETPWMSIDTSVGTVPAGGSFDITIDFASAELDLGEYLGSIMINSNDPMTPMLTVPVSLSVSDAASGAGGLPTAFVLKQNHPNPFNPSTTIKFALPNSGPVSLVVYDIAGRLVKTLVNGNMEATNHSVVWNGRDSSDRQVSSGVYYYRLVADGFTDTRKMMLVK